MMTRRHFLRCLLAGGGDFREDHIGIDRTLKGLPQGGGRILLVHNPDMADSGFEGHVDLILAGPTHGGQVRIPFRGGAVLPVQNKACEAGVVQTTKGHTMIIPRGIGWAIYPARFDCYSEFAVVELV